MRFGLYVSAIAVGLLAGFVGAVKRDDGNSPSLDDKFDLLCSKKYAEISDHSEMVKMISLIAEGRALPRDCPEGAKDALLDLTPVLINVNDICSPESIDQITLYWTKYMNKKSKHYKLLPKPIRKFFIEFGFFASQSCKNNIIENILRVDQVSQFITQQDIEFVAHLTDGDKLGKVIGKTMELEDLFLVADFETVRKKQGIERETETVLVSREKNYLIEQIKHRCEKNLKPIYENLIMPVVKLALLGFNYKSDKINADLKELYGLESYKNLFRIVLACEPILKYKFEVKPESIMTDDGTALVTVLSETEVAELRAKAGLPLNGNTEQQVEETLEAPVFAPKAKLIWDHSALQGERRLRSAVKSYSKSLKDRDLARLQLLKRSMALYKVWLTSKKLKIGLKELDANRRTVMLRSLDKYGKLDEDEIHLISLFISAIIVFAIKIALSVAVGFAMHMLLGVAPHLAALIWIVGILIILDITIL